MPNTTGYFGKRGELRIYSGTSDGLGGKYYFKVAFEQLDLTFPAGRPRPDDIPVLDRGLLTSFGHFLQGPDTPLMNPVQVTFSCQIEAAINRTELRRALSNLENESPWTVGGTTWTDVNGTSLQYNGFGSAISTPPPYDPLQKRVNLETLWRVDETATSDIGFRMNETYFRPDEVRIAEAADSLRFQVTGRMFGPVSQITAFTSGTNVNSA